MALESGHVRPALSRFGSMVYFEVALLIALLGFASTVALAKFLMRGEIIE